MPGGWPIAAAAWRTYMPRMTQTSDTAATASKPKESGENSPGTPAASPQAVVTEIGGRKGPEPTRYGDWEKDGRCVDF